MAEHELPALYYAAIANDLAEVERLLTAGADPNDGESIFHAAEKNHREVIDRLIGHGCDISGTHAIYGNTPLFFLCGYRDDQEGRAPWYQGIAYLLERGADPNVPSGASHETPLHKIALSPRMTATARLLLGHGADPKVRNAQGVAPYQLAMRHGNTPVATLFAEAGGGVPLTAEDEFHGGVHCRHADDDYCTVVMLLRAAGGTREASINRYNETPESMATARVAECLTRHT